MKRIPFNRINITGDLNIRPDELPGPDTDILFSKDPHMIDSYNILFTQHPRPGSLFEIGIAFGGSLLLWHWLGIKQVCGIDHNLGRFQPKDYCDKNNIGYYNCTIFDTEKTISIVNIAFPHGIDWIIDDGAHTVESILIGFKTLWDKLNIGGLYIIEDWSALHQIHRMEILETLVDDLIGDWQVKYLPGPRIRNIQLRRTMMIIEKI